MTNSDILKKQMIEALEKELGIVTNACKVVGIARETHYRWMREDSSYKEAVEGVENVSLDFAESKLFERIKGVEMAKVGLDGELNMYTLPPDTTAIIFYLKTKGKKRGYVERQEITGAEGKALDISIQVIGNDAPILDEPKDEM